MVKYGNNEIWSKNKYGRKWKKPVRALYPKTFVREQLHWKILENM